MRTLLSSLQWSLFILMGSIVVPITIASSYGLNHSMTVEFIQRTLFVLGLAGILQALFGHRLPIQEGPAGLWWGIFSLYAGVGPILFGSHLATLQTLQYALLLSGFIFILFSSLGWISRIAKLISPTVVGVYLILLVAQLSGPFLQAMSGLTEQTNTVNTKILILSIGIIVISFIFMKLPRVGHFSVLFTIVFGWLLFYILNLTTPIVTVEKIFKLPQIFAFGTPQIELNMVVMVFIITLLLLTNMLASIKVMEQLFKRENVQYEGDRLRQAGIISGVNQLLSGIFSTIGAVPISASAGFISTTKITSKRPFIFGSILITVIILFPPFTSFVASIPVAVGYAAIFPVFASLIGLAFQGFASVSNKNKLYKAAGISLFAGLGVMFIPPEAFTNMSPTIASIISNGLVLGSLLAIFIELILKEKN